MDHDLPVEQPDSVSEHNCVNCGRPALEEDHPTALCQECRDHFTRLTIPLWIKAFAGGIGVILLFSLFTFPKNITLGIHLKRGTDAMEKGNYLTAENELKKALETVPDNVEANGNLIIAAFYNEEIETMGKQVKKLESVEIEDKALYSHITETLQKADRYIPNDSFTVFLQAHPQLAPFGDTAWTHYLARNPEDCFAMKVYANLAFDKEAYVRCDSLLQQILKIDDSYVPALGMETSVQRELGNMDASLGYARRILAINHESAYGMATEARTLLRQKKDKPALELALKAAGLQPKDIFVEATLALAYNFNGNAAERDAALKRARALATDSMGRESIKYAQDVLDHKVKFRD